MRTLRFFCLICLFAPLALFSSCEKICMFADCDDIGGNNVVSRNGLPLSGSQEVPPVVTEASGEAKVSYNKKTKVLRYTLTWEDLSGNPTGAHIHGEAARGENAGVKHNFTDDLPKEKSGTFTNSVVVDEVGINEKDLLNGLYYFNIHTPEHPAGEIRGQIEFK